MSAGPVAPHIESMNLTITGTAPVTLPPLFSGGLRQSEVHAEYNVPSITAEDAPVAVRLPAFGDATADLRWYDGRFFQLCYPAEVVSSLGIDELQHRMSIQHYAEAESEREALRYLNEKLARYITVDGEVWDAMEEPVYVLDHNGMSVIIGDEANFETWRVYNLNERDAALAAAALLRAENHMREPHPDAFQNAEVLLPETIRTPTNIQRIVSARLEVDATVRRALELLANTTPRNLRNAGKLLLAAAEEMIAAGANR